MHLTLEQFAVRARAYAGSAFRFETLQHYAGVSERQNLALFLSGVPKPDDHNAAVHHRVRETIEAGKTWLKVKVLVRPLTDYQRYYLEWVAPGHVAVGWEHRFAESAEVPYPGLPDFDFWLYDDSDVAVLQYDDGVPVAVEMIEGDIERFRRWRDRAVEVSVPFDEFRT